MKNMLTGISVATILFGCATQPEDVQTQYVSPIQYQNYECNQIAPEMERVSRRLNELYRGLKKTANDDETQMGLGLVLFWPALFFLDGSDSPQAAEYGRLKGEYDALESAAIQKNCTIAASARVAKWIQKAHDAAKETCPMAKIPSLLSNTGQAETYEVACTGGSTMVVRCAAEACKVLQ